MRLVY